MATAIESLNQIAADAEALTVNALLTPALEKQIKDIHERLIGSFERLDLNVVEDDFFRH